MNSKQRASNRRRQAEFRARKKEKEKLAALSIPGEDIWRRNLDALTVEELAALQARHEAFIDIALPLHGFIKFVNGSAEDFVFADVAFEAAMNFIQDNPLVIPAFSK